MHWISARPCTIARPCPRPSAPLKASASCSAGRRYRTGRPSARASARGCGPAAGWCSRTSASTRAAVISATRLMSTCSTASRAIGAQSLARRADQPNEYANATFQQVLQDPRRIRRAVSRPGLAGFARGAHAGKLVHDVTPCPYAEAFREHGDAKAFARGLCADSAFVVGGRVSPARSIPRGPPPSGSHRRRFLFAYEADVAAAPEGHRMDYVPLRRGNRQARR